VGLQGFTEAEETVRQGIYHLYDLERCEVGLIVLLGPISACAIGM